MSLLFVASIQHSNQFVLVIIRSIATIYLFIGGSIPFETEQSTVGSYSFIIIVSHHHAKICALFYFTISVWYITGIAPEGVEGGLHHTQM